MAARKDRWRTIDGNEAAAAVAYRLSEVIAIYPITPASPMGELSDDWATAGQPNLFGLVPRVIELQSEAGVAGAVHGAVQAGALATTFTSSQGLLLMLPNMYKLAGELSSVVIHVAARTLATHALSIFGDQGDVMAARATGFAMLCSSSVQEAQDLALVAHAATLESRIPFLHFFDGFRTSHEVNKIQAIGDEEIRAMVPMALVERHRARGLDPDHPVLRGSAQNPDVFFQQREASNPYYLAVPGVVQGAMYRLAALTGRDYRLFDYVGAETPERVVVVMGSAVGAVEETVARLNREGERVGVVKVRLYRPFDGAALAAAIPESARTIAVLDRSKEPGATGEPLYEDVVAALSEHRARRVNVIGGRYGLSSKEFTPAMAAAVFAELGRAHPRRHFTVGIEDDVTHLSLDYDPAFTTEGDDVVRAVFFGLGSDGTVGANKNSIKIIGEHTPLHAQGYFVYDSKKSGQVTVSHLRFGPRPITSTYLVQSANFVACHNFGLLERLDVLDIAAPGATFLLNSPHPADTTWDRLPREVQASIIDKGLRLYVIDAAAIAREAGLPASHVNTVLQTCFFALAGVLPHADAIAAIKAAIKRSYGKRGEEVVERNWRAVDMALAGLHPVVPAIRPTSDIHVRGAIPEAAPAFVRQVTAGMLAGRGDMLPVSALPADGTFPTATSRWEKRGIADEIPVWDPTICIDCAKCVLVCPHSAIRMKVYPEEALVGAPEDFKLKPWAGRDHDGLRMTIQVAPDDCTACGVCVDYCPAFSREEPARKALEQLPREPRLDAERRNWDFFLGIPEADRTSVNVASIKGSQQLQPLFEFPGACAGCGQTPYLRLLTQMYGDRILVANATGCSSIYGGNLPTTPWSHDANGRGPAWANSLFEDNAEFGLGMRVALDARLELARSLLARLRPAVGGELADAILEGEADQSEVGLAAQRLRVADLRLKLAPAGDGDAARLAAMADVFVHRQVWIVGGDGWAYDIGFGGLDHVLASGSDVNVLVLDTEVYSNTGGQASKSTPRGAVARFASGGKRTRKKDLGLMAMSYGDVYVAQVALGADNQQTIRALAEAASYPGPSLVIAYGSCIAHGIDMREGIGRQRDAVRSAYWPLYRYDPRREAAGETPLTLDSRRPTLAVAEFEDREERFTRLHRALPEAEAERVLAEAQADVDRRWHRYELMADGQEQK